MKQFVLPDGTAAEGGRLVLEGRDFHYLVRVRRCREGDRILGITREGKRFEILFETVGESRCEVQLLPVEDTGDFENRENGKPTRIILIPGITKGKKMDLTVRQAVEAGAAAVYPILTDHCQVQYRNTEDAEAKKKRWDRIAIEALQQCGGTSATEIAVPGRLQETVSAWGNRGPLFFLHEKALTRNNHPEIASGLFDLLAEPTGELGIIVGPEGGLSPAETAFLLDNGAVPLFLGKRVLRAETAAIYGLAAVATIIRERSEWHPA